MEAQSSPLRLLLSSSSSMDSPSAIDYLEVLVLQIKNLKYSDEFSDLLDILEQHDDFIMSQATRLRSCLDQLNPAIQSLGYLYLLEAYSRHPISSEQASRLFVNFINSCSEEQIRFAPHKFISVCKRFRNEVMQLQVPIQGVAPFRTALRKLHSDRLTTLHTDFLLLCILSKCYRAAQCILDEDIFEVDRPIDLLLYFYYGGMINIGLKRYGKALECFRYVLNAPTTSLLAVEGYKKYILVSLVHNGQIPRYPKNKNTPLDDLKSLKHSIQAYIDLANSYTSGKFSELETSVQTNRNKFQSDKNFGLVKQILSSFHEHNIQKLAQAYSTRTLQDIANTAQLNTAKDAELYILRMIQDGKISATINQKDGMINFHEDSEQYKTYEMIEHIESAIQRLMTLSKKLKAIDKQMRCDPAYVKKKILKAEQDFTQALQELMNFFAPHFPQQT